MIFFRLKRWIKGSKGNILFT